MGLSWNAIDGMMQRAVKRELSRREATLKGWIKA